MHALRGTRRLLAGLAFVAFSIGLVPSMAWARPWPGARPDQGFRLFARSFGYIAVNRVFLGLSTRGEVGNDSTGSGTIGGGYWPRGTADEYVFNSGLQIAGVIQGAKGPGNPWGGDTAGGFFFDARGLNKSGAEVTKIYNGNVQEDVDQWPDAARVPQGDAGEELFDPLLRGKINASQGDAWFMTWEGDPAFISGRPHPLGIAAEYRVMGWNYPSGNEDLVYLIITFYNITTTNAADYSQHRPAMRSILMDQANKFQSLNNAKFGITLPTGGYTIGPAYAAFSADMDVGSAGVNFSSVNLPFALGFAYQRDFGRPPSWLFDPSIFGAPFFPGVGFVGTKYLKSPTGAGKIQLFSNTINGGGVPDPPNTFALFRYLSGTPIPSIDGQCNVPGDPQETHICFVRQGTAVDIRYFQSSSPLTVGPGESASIVVSYIFAAPVAVPGFTPVAGTNYAPGDPTWVASPDSMAKYNGANLIDSLTGFLKYTGPTRNPDDSPYEPQMSDYRVVPGSLLGKALVAQTVFDNHFLLPFSPERPEFFLIPGDGKVTVLWKPSASEATGDAYYTVAGSATVTTPTGTGPNSLYDPNYRQYDVEGYRLYRGRTDAPNSLKLVQQWDYSGTEFSDYGGNVLAGDQGANCAPELGVLTQCEANYTKITPGVTSTVHHDFDLGGGFAQVKYGDRAKLANGDIVLLKVDTAITGGGSGLPALSNNGVPFVYTDRDVSNNVTYFYTLTAFDVNSVNSAPSSLESGKVTKPVTVGASASNYTSTGGLTVLGVFGRNGALTDKTAPTIDPATGKFSKKALPANGFSVGVSSFVSEVLKGGTGTVRFDSAVTNSVTAVTNAGVTEYFSVITASGTATFTVPVTIDATGTTFSTSGSFTAVPIDAGLAQVYGGGSGYTLPGSWSLQEVGAYFTTNKGRGCVNNAGGFGSSGGYASRQCWYNGQRWFQGDNETKDNPNSSMPDNFDTGLPQTDFNNAGELPGVKTINFLAEYNNISSSWRDVALGLAAYMTAADYRVYWGAAGKIDSVIDLTHDTEVPFNSVVRGSWGILNASAVPTTSYDQRAALTQTDWMCVNGIRQFSAMQVASCSGVALPGVSLSQTAVPGPVAFFHTSYGNARTAPQAANNGFGLYIKGRVFIFELEGGAVPAAGTEWTMRDYAGGVNGGSGAAGDYGPYAYFDVVRPFTAPGASIKFAIDANNELRAPDSTALAKVHTVPDPYYVTSAYDRSVTNKNIKFVNVPTGATIRIYSASGVLIRVLQNTSTTYGGTVNWDVRNRSNQFIASGVYFYHVEADNGSGGKVSRVGRLTVVNFASNVQ